MEGSSCSRKAVQEVVQSRKEEGHEQEHEAPVLRGRQFTPEAMA